ncbi:MAG: discoidin domain-containing protein [Acidobacteria bacterium]|nr:discoidin domain-containing protein [Acidobacteriota bacterium]
MNPRAALAACLLAASAPPAELDDPAAWKPVPSDGVELRIGRGAGRKGPALRLDFDFRGHAGYAIARRALPLELPENFAFSFWIRAEAPVNTLEFKLLDPAGENVWWTVRRNFEFPRDWQRIVVKKRHLQFAWGPSGGGEPRRAGAIEIVVTAATGGAGSVFIDDLSFVELPPERPYTRTPVASASSTAPGHGPGLALDADPASAWRAEQPGAAWTVDFLEPREFGGLVLDWDPADYATRYALEGSDDGREWFPLRAVERGNGGRDYLATPEASARWVRLRIDATSRGAGAGLRNADIRPLEFGKSPTALLQAVAADAPRGAWPRSLLDQQLYWTIVGVDGDTEEALLSEDGALEPFAAGFSLEPFVFEDGAAAGWAAFEATQSLPGDGLPLPSVTWARADLRMDIEAVADGPAGSSMLLARYRLRSTNQTPRDLRLLLALRPLQVNPPWQFLNVPGGAARVGAVAWDGRALAVDGEARVVPWTPPSQAGAASFDEGEAWEHVRLGRVPPRAAVEDPARLASAVLAFDLRLAARGEAEVIVALPLHAAARGAALDGAARADAGAAFAARREAVARGWRERLGRVEISGPPELNELAATLRANLAYVLVNRDGPRIQPGSRAYARSWIRDGALTSLALLRLGHPGPVREFLEWFAPLQFPDGKVPCCADSRGADPVPENDSHGELIHAIAEYVRYTGDRGFAAAMWPHARAAALYIDTLRQQRRTAEYRTPEKAAFFGLVPESISHEGYSAKPMHSYWDDAFALVGLEDAAGLAALLGHDEDHAHFAEMAREFRGDLHASIRRTIADHGIGYIPGCVELGDEDPTSTTVLLEPGREIDRLPRAELEATFARYIDRLHERAAGGWSEYTPYEWRIVGSLLRLGWPDRAHELARFLLPHRRPEAWRHWAEVVWREPRRPKFIGDMPHTWVGSDFIRSFLDMFAYDRAADGALVLGAGIGPWLAGGEPVRVTGLRTPHGTLDLEAAAVPGGVRYRIGGDTRLPPGGFVASWPFAGKPRAATVDGEPATIGPGGDVVARKVPCEVVLLR